MKSKEVGIKKFIRNLKIYVNVNDSLAEVLNKHISNNLSVVFIVDEDDSTLIGTIDGNQLDEIKTFNKATLNAVKVKDYIGHYDIPIVVYPNMSNVEALEIMEQFQIEYLPVLNSPWNKRLAGFVWHEEISWSNDILLG